MATPDFNTIADSISKISVTGLTIFDLNEIPGGITNKLPCALPAPRFVTNFRPTNIDLSRQEMDFNYTLNYRILASQAGSDRGLHQAYPAIASALSKFLNAIATNHDVTGLEDLQIENISAFGPVQGPDELTYNGCDVALSVLEFK